MNNSFIQPKWSAPANVHAWTTTSIGGVSSGPYTSLNLAMHVNDEPESVLRNRSLIAEKLAMPSEPFWLEQVHGPEVISLDEQPATHTADGSITCSDGKVCVVMTADCLPVLLCNQSGTAVAALHAGWRGLAAGILEQGVSLMPGDDDVLAWLGPAIGPDKFQVGSEVVEGLAAGLGESAGWSRPAAQPGKYLVDIYRHARMRLEKSGVAEVSGGGLCTFTDDRHFFSYRRQGQCGRMATLIWLDPPV
jgi:YfiH family protein